jgi:predicted ester cyclase
MSAEQNKALFARLLDELNKGNFGVIDEVIAPDAVLYSPHLPEPVRGRAAFKEVFDWAAAVFDIRYTLEEQIAEGDKVAARFTARGTHKQEFLGVPPTGKPTEEAVQVIYRVAGDQIVDYRLSWDQLALLQQMGATITPPRRAGG